MSAGRDVIVHDDSLLKHIEEAVSNANETSDLSFYVRTN